MTFSTSPAAQSYWQPDVRQAAQEAVNNAYAVIHMPPPEVIYVPSFRHGLHATFLVSYRHYTERWTSNGLAPKSVLKETMAIVPKNGLAPGWNLHRKFRTLINHAAYAPLRAEKLRERDTISLELQRAMLPTQGSFIPQPALFGGAYSTGSVAMKTGDQIKPLQALDKLSCGAWFYHNVAILAALPSEIRLDPLGHLHSVDEQPAVDYAEGSYKVYAWHGTSMLPTYITKPVTFQRIIAQRNLEIQRCLLDRFGVENFVDASGAAVVHEDTDLAGNRRRLLVIPNPAITWTEEDFTFCEVTCPSTGSRYMLRVPPTTKTCQQGVAWTFGINDPASYAPLVET